MGRERIKEIQQTVLALSDDDFRELYQWIAELDHQKWDKQIEEDSDRRKNEKKKSDPL